MPGVLSVINLPISRQTFSGPVGCLFAQGQRPEPMPGRPDHGRVVSADSQMGGRA
jgi:hypothetical protein